MSVTGFRRALARLGCALFGHAFRFVRKPINGWRDSVRWVEVPTTCRRCGHVHGCRPVGPVLVTRRAWAFA